MKREMERIQSKEIKGIAESFNALFTPYSSSTELISIALYVQGQVRGDHFDLQHTAGVFWCSLTER